MESKQQNMVRKLSEHKAADPIHKCCFSINSQLIHTSYELSECPHRTEERGEMAGTNDED